MISKILILYVFHIFNNRVKYFFDNAIFYDENIDFLIISNNLSFDYNFKLKNVKLLKRENIGFDFGGWSYGLFNDNLYLNYDKFIFANSSIFGPFLLPDFKGKWTDFYINGLNDDIKLFGSTINPSLDALNRLHVQSYIFSMDIETLKFLIKEKIFSIENNVSSFDNTIDNKEILMSRKIINNNWNIGSLLKFYKNVDFRFIDKKPEDYNLIFLFLDDVMYPPYKDCKIWNEYDLIFIKGNRFNL